MSEPTPKDTHLASSDAEEPASPLHLFTPQAHQSDPLAPSFDSTASLELPVVDPDRLPLLLNVPEMCALLRVSDATLREMVRTTPLGEIVVRVGRQLRFPRPSVFRVLGFDGV